MQLSGKDVSLWFSLIFSENPFIEQLRGLFMKIRCSKCRVSLTSNEPQESLIKKETVKTNANFFQTLHFFAKFYLRNIPNFVELWLTLVFQSISWKEWAANQRNKNSYNILQHLACNVQKPQWKNMRNFQDFSFTKEQNLWNKFTLSHFVKHSRNNVYTDIFHNSQMEWHSHFLSGSLQPTKCLIHNS